MYRFDESYENSSFPGMVSFFSVNEFETPFGECFSAVGREVCINTQLLAQVKPSFHKELLHKIARVSIMNSPIIHLDNSKDKRTQPGIEKTMIRQRRKIPDALVDQLKAEADFRCQVCGASEHDGATLEVDHIIPFSEGGTDDYDNLQILCATCNRKKGKKLYFNGEELFS